MRARRLARLLGCTFLAACAACDNAGGNPFGGMGPGSDGGGLAAHSITDANGFERPMEAVRIMVPRGWRVGSSVKWDGNGQCSLDIASPMARLTSPDGSQVIDILPGFLVSTWADPILNRGIQPVDYCVVARAESGEALMRVVAGPRLKPGAALQSLTRQPIPAELEQAVQQQRSQMLPGGTFDAYAVAGSFRSADGAAEEKIVLKGSVMTLPPLGNGIPQMVLNENNYNLALRAPPGRMAELERLAATVVASVRFNPEWQRRVNEVRRKMAEATNDAIHERGRIISRRSRHGGRPRTSDWQRDQDRRDYEHRRFIDEVIREEQRCYDPETGEVVTVPTSIGC